MMDETREFERCIYCFAPVPEKEEAVPDKNRKDPCPVCGYRDGDCLLAARWLAPGSILKGRYMTGRLLAEKPEELVYLGWDIERECTAEIHEYYPAKWLQRDITASVEVYCLNGFQEEYERGRRDFFERVRLYNQCVSRVEPIFMDFFARNGTCYYVKEDPEERKTEQEEDTDQPTVKI